MNFREQFIFMKSIIVATKKFGTKEILVDDEDYDLLNSMKWFIVKAPRNFYAHTWKWNTKTKQNDIRSMHRIILGATDSDTLVDHKDHNGLNNQRINLRKCSKLENCRNRRANINTTSKYIGVSFKKTDKRYKKLGYWYAQININGKRKGIGRYDIEEDAARAYDSFSKLHYGEFANLNFK